MPLKNTKKAAKRKADSWPCQWAVSYGCGFSTVVLALVIVMVRQGLVASPEASLSSMLRYGVLGVALLCCCLCNMVALCDVERLTAREVAYRLFQYWEDHPDRACELPEKLSGVFWMSDSPAPQLLVCFEAAVVDLDRQTATLREPLRYSWSYCDDWRGWLQYLSVRLFGGNIIVFEWDKGWKFATVKFWLFGLVPPSICSLFSRSTIKQLDDEGDCWAHDTYIPGYAANPSRTRSYTLVKVIDKEGYELPAFKAMMRSITECQEVKGSPAKIAEQFTPIS